MIADLAETRAKLLPTLDSNPINRVCDAAEDLLHPTTRPDLPRTVPTSV
jgi:hypothetical protein